MNNSENFTATIIIMCILFATNRRLACRLINSSLMRSIRLLELCNGRRRRTLAVVNRM